MHRKEKSDFRKSRFMRVLRLFMGFAIMIPVSGHAKIGKNISGSNSAPEKKSIITSRSLYTRLNLSKLGLSPDVFAKAFDGWSKLAERHELNKQHLLTILDLTQSSASKRFYIIDMERGIVVFNTYAAHGRNSGEEFAHSFSNDESSHKTSLGFYITSNTYNGKHGLSMQLKGVEKGINDLAEKRGIVLHGADYVSENFIKQTGRLGRSHGCPAVSNELKNPIIELLKDGSCLFIYYPDKDYQKKSTLLTHELTS